MSTSRSYEPQMNKVALHQSDNPSTNNKTIMVQILPSHLCKVSRGLNAEDADFNADLLSLKRTNIITTKTKTGQQ